MEKQNQYEEIITFSNKAALQLIKLEDFPSAKEYLDRCLDLLKSRPIRKSSRLLGITLNNYGCYFKRQGFLEKSLEFFYKAIDCTKSSDSALSETYLNISNVLSQQLDHYGALYNALKALKSLPTNKRKSETGVLAYQLIGKEYEFLNKPKEAAKMYFNGLMLAQQIFGSTHRYTKELESAYCRLEKVGNRKTMTPRGNSRSPKIEGKGRYTPDVITERLNDFIPAPVNFEEIFKEKKGKFDNYRSITPTVFSKNEKIKNFNAANGGKVVCKLCRNKSLKKKGKFHADKLVPVPRRYKMSLSSDRLHRSFK